ncbi:hypothetical protein BpHYR1_045171 [Brachionus plicatilis]|uniref:Cystatin domain-containing protein n=1 Tax=Brachionus plicatilis TaxID=10195 RepID=A0A3M7P478_BRAPC|nr:hypothetical protein BpHYR1_045171 [Brachionus plicatilis]
MFKLLAICFTLFVASQAFAVGGYQPATATDEFMSLARWSANQMSSYTGVLGQHNLMTVRNLMTQVVNGINYKFTIDLLVQTPENQYFFRSCDLTVFDQPWTNTREIVGTPKCGANPYYP